MINLDRRWFQPVQNSKAGRVKGDAIFKFRQQGPNFVATYSGAGVSDGHLIGQMTSRSQADIVYHSRAADGALEVGEAKAHFLLRAQERIEIEMTWRWLNGSQAHGASHYREVVGDRSSKI